MKWHRSNIAKSWILLSFLLLTLAVAGCEHSEAYSRANSKLKIVPVSNRDIATLSANDVIEIMRRAGFSDEQILQLGPDLQKGLAESGAAHFRVGNKLEAIFAVNGDYVHITTRLRGSFVYDMKKGWVQGKHQRRS
jgi:hypothetical protein